MNGLPSIGDKVKIWPAPGRKVQDGARTLDVGGRLLTAPREVKWDYHYHEQYLAGDLYLHDPTPDPEASKKGAEIAKEAAKTAAPHPSNIEDGDEPKDKE